LLEADYDKSSSTEIPEWARPSWIGTQLRANDMVEASELGRKRIFGKNLRLYKFTDRVLQKERRDDNGNSLHIVSKQAPDAFCKGCHGCPYRNAGCEFQPKRMQEDQHSKAVAMAN